jgi:hypothetical protein
MLYTKVDVKATCLEAPPPCSLSENKNVKSGQAGFFTADLESNTNTLFQQLLTQKP